MTVFIAYEVKICEYKLIVGVLRKSAFLTETGAFTSPFTENSGFFVTFFRQKETQGVSAYFNRFIQQASWIFVMNMCNEWFKTLKYENSDYWGKRYDWPQSVAIF